jgi:K+-sensing histidine kinase KdpD
MVGPVPGGTGDGLPDERAREARARESIVGSRRPIAVIEFLTAGPAVWGLVAIGAAMVVGWLLAATSSETVAVTRHWFYVPVVLAAVRHGAGGALVAAGIAGLLAGPLVPLPEGSAGPTPSQWLLRPLFFAGVGVLVGVLTDAVRRHERDKVALAEYAREVVARERDLAVQRAALIQTVSHELRTPLTIIKGSVLTWSRMGDQVSIADASRLVPPMQRAAERLESLVSTLLAAGDAQRDEELRPVPVRMSQLVHEATRRVNRPDAHSRVELVGDGDPDVTTVPEYVVTSLALLLDNALRFSPQDEPVVVVPRLSGSEFEIEVLDRGPGLDPARVEGLFEPFTQGDQSSTRVHEGLGLGLYTARKLVSRLGGDVQLAPAVAGGTSARITLPSGSGC